MNSTIDFVWNKFWHTCSARLSGGAGCSRLVSTWFGWFKKLKNTVNPRNTIIHKKERKTNKKT